MSGRAARRRADGASTALHAFLSNKYSLSVGRHYRPFFTGIYIEKIYIIRRLRQLSKGQTDDRSAVCCLGKVSHNNLEENDYGFDQF